MAETNTTDTSVFQTKFNEFVVDLLNSLPEYSKQLQTLQTLDDSTKLRRFQEEVKVSNTLGGEDNTKNPGKILPNIEISDSIWTSLSENTKKAIWEHVRILSICCFMEAGFTEGSKPAWMDDAMNDMKKKLEGVDFQDIIKKFMTFFKSSDTSAASATSGPKSGLEGLFENGFPKIPEKFLKGHMAKLAQEIVQTITPDDLGISPELIKECEKNPSRSFEILFSVFGSKPDMIQNTVQKIGKRLQQKIMSGAIRPQEIAREAEELMKEFATNSSFVDMMNGIKTAFGFEDMDLARQAGREGSARLSIARNRLRNKLEKKNQLKGKK